jgi:hypothetical protein
MPLITKKMPSWEGVGAGQRATLRMPVGLRYHKLLIPYSSLTPAQIDEIRVIANGKPIMRYTGGDILDSINQFDGRAAASGVLTLDFERYGLRTRAGSELTVIDTTKPDNPNQVQITTLTIEMDINSGATTPSLGTAKAVQSGKAANSNPLLKHVRVFGYDPAGSGDFQISDLPKMGAINRILFKSASTINSIKLERDGYVVFERDQAENEVVQSDGVRVPQSGYYAVDFTEEGNGQDWLEVRGAQDVRFTLDMAAAGHVDAIVEYIDTLNGA